MNRHWISRFSISALVSTAAFGLAAGQALAQSYPNKPIAFIVPYGPGAGNDVIARLVSQKVTDNQ